MQSAAVDVAGLKDIDESNIFLPVVDAGLNLGDQGFEDSEGIGRWQYASCKDLLVNVFLNIVLFEQFWTETVRRWILLSVLAAYTLNSCKRAVISLLCSFVFHGIRAGPARIVYPR